LSEHERNPLGTGNKRDLSALAAKSVLSIAEAAGRQSVRGFSALKMLAFKRARDRFAIAAGGG
jgi:hypothetical protein